MSKFFLKSLGANSLIFRTHHHFLIDEKGIEAFFKLDSVNFKNKGKSILFPVFFSDSPLGLLPYLLVAEKKKKIM